CCGHRFTSCLGFWRARRSIFQPECRAASLNGCCWQDSYLCHVVRFSFWQAFLSALLSVVPAIFLARALYRRRFPGRLALLRLCAMTLILP
ncbi:hypothetical protein ACUOFC_58460, partial [Escherichia sp. TWPC-MK]